MENILKELKIDKSRLNLSLNLKGYCLIVEPSNNNPGDIYAAICELKPGLNPYNDKSHRYVVSSIHTDKCEKFAIEKVYKQYLAYTQKMKNE